MRKVMAAKNFVKYALMALVLVGFVVAARMLPLADWLEVFTAWVSELRGRKKLRRKSGWIVQTPAIRLMTAAMCSGAPSRNPNRSSADRGVPGTAGCPNAPIRRM